MNTSDATRRALMEHVEAFNGHDRDRLLRGLHDRVIWATGKDVVLGRSAAAVLFDDWLWSMRPRLDLVRLIVEGEAAAAECVEHLTVDGNATQIPIGVFFTVREGLLASVKVFREGSADVLAHKGHDPDPTPPADA